MVNFTRGITRLWWIPLITGIVAVGLGIWCLCSPVTSVPVLAYIFAGLICLAGVFNLVYVCVNRAKAPNWGWALALGLLDLLAGIWMLSLPEEELAVTFVIVLGIWLICVAINAICETFVLSTGSILWTVFSVIMLIATIWFAVMFLSSPLTMAVAGWIYLGISLITFGAFRISISCRLRSLTA
jgi:uncharacterized membrane protein HdeD (DUF308 family)